VGWGGVEGNLKKRRGNSEEPLNEKKIDRETSPEGLVKKVGDKGKRREFNRESVVEKSCNKNQE